ncbi:peptide-methionine (R)-S-oxide reductase [Psychrosphaera saromensis]|uniref:Peptide methionine sulfoxide reductase MsrB n=1 Tax=Psychrosphaera saromensis TaxID=716813 RepID=A0A2S7UW40_9GAMM|nr:peptide-methionine (R)-S-oxide reductase MsrB [Psychrosphaera saromensis]PQJ54163.1 peptide-methionine (R)-S-oxide reductase [Psychrosphaera saromensis]GHB75458.1 peptide-methionine (R)-S-oxide reductase [Psychrosphaera saromensis]GLQ12744.1 peptide-methionine (R)-S-oxide reductase [Psychrosphaera saromensis]
MTKSIDKIVKTEAQWQSLLDDETYRVTRLKGTEHPYTGKYLEHNEQGKYACVCCGSELFNSEQKFDSHCGWPSFDQSIEGAVDYHKDSTLGMIRVEITCANCDAHLGHIFEDGPTETGNRYCVNSVSLTFGGEK